MSEHLQKNSYFGTEHHVTVPK